MDRSRDERGNRRDSGGKRRYRGMLFLEYFTFTTFGSGRDKRNRDRGRSGYIEVQEQPVEDSPEKRLTTLLIILGDKMTPKEITTNIEKAYIYGTLVGLVNVTRPEVGVKVVKMTAQTLQQCLNEGNWRGAKLSLKFFGELTNANVILPRTMLDIYDELLTVLDEQKLKISRADTIVYIVLASLPYVATRLRERCPDALENMLAKTERYFYARERTILDIDGSVVRKSIQPYVGSKVPYEQHDMLELLWTQIQNLKRNDWVCPCLLKPWSDYDSVLITADQHEVDKFVVPEQFDGMNNSLPTTMFRIFVGFDDEPTMKQPDVTDITYLVINDVIEDIVDVMEVNRKECVKYLKDLPYCFAPETFVGKDTTIAAAKTDIKEEPETKRILFDRVDIMDVECCYRFWNWFSHHLSNFSFIWNWKDWESALKLDPLHPKVCFLRETFQKMVRYSYYERIKSTIPDEFSAIFPIEPSTNFKYEDSAHPLHSLAETLLGKIRKRASIDDVQTYFKEMLSPALPVEDKEQTKRDIFIQCVLMQGCKSFSHVLNVIERYLSILQSLNDTAENKFLGILLDKLLNYRVIDASSIITWLFTDEMEKEVSKSYMWEIMKNTINKVISRVKQVQYKLESLMNPPADSGIIDITMDKKVNTDELRNIENTLNNVTREQKEVLLTLVNLFVEMLNNKLKEYNEQGVQDPMSKLWFWWAYGFFKEIGRTYQPQISTFIVTLETIVVVPNMDPTISNIIDMIKAFGRVKDATIVEDLS
ncbi:14196_t:CDS:10 [Funneliformis geosporum]|nr:14196_t:CDS:10 [Funneliformis geosporum]